MSAPGVDALVLAARLQAAAYNDGLIYAQDHGGYIHRFVATQTSTTRSNLALAALVAEIERLTAERERLSVQIRQADERGDEAMRRAHEAEGLLLWALWHSQGGSSPVGQPIRRALGIGQHDYLTAEQIRAGSDAATRAMQSKEAA